MQVPLQLHFEGMDPVPAVEDRIRRKVGRLERLCNDMISCRVIVAQPHAHASAGSPWRVTIEASIPPGHDIVVRKRPGDHDLHDSLETVVNNAFEAAERQLKEAVQRRRHDVKTHDEPWALVLRLHPEEDYGFLKTSAGRDVYFHRNAVVGDGFDRLEIGTRVRFEETMGEEGPQATTVQILGRPGVRIGSEDDPPEATEPPAGHQG